MSSKNLGQLTVDLVAKIGGWTDGLTKAERELDRRTKRMNKMAGDFGRNIGASLRSAATGFLAFAGVAVSLDTFASGIKNAIDRADQLRDASIRLGVGVETLSALGYAAQQTGTDLEELNKGLLRLSRNANEALVNPKSRQNAFFDALGISRDSLSNLDRLVPEIADAFSKMEDGATKAAIAQELFGRSGANLIEFLNQGGDGLRELSDRARELGVVINDDTAAAADDFNDRLADLKAAGTGFATQLAEQLLPRLDELVLWATDFVTKGDGAKDVANALGDALDGMADALNDIQAIGGPVLGFLGRTRDMLAGLEKQAQGVTFALSGNLAEASRLYGIGTDQINGTLPNFDNVRGGSDSAFENVRGGADTVSGGPSITGRLAKLLDKPGGGASRSRAKQLSDEEKEARRLKESYDNLIASYNEQIALVGKRTEFDKVYYEVTKGELAGLTAAEKELALQRAASLDDAMERQRLIEDESEALKQQKDAVQELFGALEFERELIGKTTDEREAAIQMRGWDAESVREYGDRIVDANRRIRESYENMQQGIEAADGLRDSFRGFLSDLREGEGLVGALENAFLRLADSWFDAASRMAAEQLFGNYGTTGAGSSGGGWLASLFDFWGSANSGFGFADGGFTGFGGKYEPAGIVHKGEYVMPMDAVSRIGVGNLDRMARGGAVGGVNQTFVTAGLETRETRERKAQLAGREARRALARTGR